MQARGDVIVLGALNGLTYGLLAAGLVLAFRSSRVLNLAVAQIGAFAAVVLGILVIRWEAPYWTALPFALCVGAALAALVEMTVVRRLRHVPPLVALVATLGVAQVLQHAGVAIGGAEVARALFPEPPGLPSWQLGALTVTPAHVAILVLAPLAVAVTAWALARTGFGLFLRASAADRDGARALGIRADRYAAGAWAVGGALAALAVILVLPAGGYANGTAMGPDLLLRALAAAVLAGMTSLPVALLAGVGIGVVEEILRWNAAAPAVADGVLALVVAAAVLAGRAPRPSRASAVAWTAFAPWAPLPAAARAVPLVRHAGPAAAGTLAAAAVAAPLVIGDAGLAQLSVVLCVAIVAVAAWMTLALSGRLSFGHAALAGCGAAGAAMAARAGADPLLGLAAAGLAGAAGGAVLAGGQRRSGDLGLTVLSLALAVAADRWLLRQEWALGLGTEVPPLQVGPLDTGTPAGGYLLALAGLLAAVAWASRLAAGAFGRAARAARDNDAAARALGVPGIRLHTDVVVASGAVAGFGGGLLTHAVTTVTPEHFAVTAGIEAVAMALVGGLGLAGGALLGALWIGALPAFVDLPAAALAATAGGWLLLLLYVPSGLQGLLEPARRGIAVALLRLSGQDPARARELPAAAAERSPIALAPRRGDEATGRGAEPVAAGALPMREPPAAAGDGLRLDGIRKRFDGVTALDGVTLEVRGGEHVALIGANGAGKTTLLDIASGLQRADEGRVIAGGRDVTSLRAEQRALAGLGRSFQAADLFPTLTVRELVLLGCDPRRRLPATTAERRAAGWIATFGLARFADARIGALSTGTRRVAELAALLALGPRVLLLDEPSAGLARPEVEALGELLAGIPARTGAALLVVEHDLGLVSSVADRVVVLAEGRIVLDGPPAGVIDRAGTDATGAPVPTAAAAVAG